MDATSPIRASDWIPGSAPRDVEPEAPRGDGSIRWFEVTAASAGAEQLHRQLGSACPGLTAEMLADVLRPDEEPAGKSYADGEIKLASTCAVEARSNSAKAKRGEAGGVGGALVISPVELLAGEDWLISCWHPARVFVGPTNAGEEAPADSAEHRECVVRRWSNGTGRTAGDLGVLAIDELLLGYGDAHRTLLRWVEDWELSYHQDLDLDQADLDARRGELASLWGSMAVLRDWIRPQNRVGLSEDIGKAWLPATDAELVVKADNRIDRALEGIDKLANALRAGFSLLHVQQLEEARERREDLMRRIEIGAAVFLIPTLVVGFYGANTWVPGQGAHWGFWVMLAALVLLSALGVLMVLRWQRRDRRS